MKIQVVRRPEITVVGPLAVTKQADSAAISRLWEEFEQCSKAIKHKGANIGYELHISGQGSHYCLTGIEVTEMTDLPLNCFAKTIPAGQYAVFTHKYSEGSYTQVYAQISTWLKNNAPSDANAFEHFEVQVYDDRFKGPDNPESIVDFLIPLFKL